MSEKRMLLTYSGLKEREDELRQFLPELALVARGSPEEAASPGLRYRHYAPRKPFCVLEGSAERAAAFVRAKARFARVAALCFDDEAALYEDVPTVLLGRSDEYAAQAARLFDALRDLDETDAEQLYARLPAPDGLGATVRDRLRRAAGGKSLDVEEV